MRVGFVFCFGLGAHGVCVVLGLRVHVIMIGADEYGHAVIWSTGIEAVICNKYT